MNNNIYINEVSIRGKITSIKYSHTLHSEDFFEAIIEVQRLSNYADSLPVIISSKLVKENIKLNYYSYFITGEIRTRNIKHKNKQKLQIYVFAYNFYSDNNKEDMNKVYLGGYVCKSPTFRVTPLKRKITDVLIAVNRPFFKSSYIPCITWRRIAYFSNHLNVGDYIQIEGRLQSRLYDKKIEENVVKKTAYEVSVKDLSFVTPNKCIF